MDAPLSAGRLDVRDWEKEEIEALLVDAGSILTAVAALAALVYMHGIAMEFSKTPRLFPLAVIRIGIPIAAALVVKEILTRIWLPDLFADSDDEVMEHLRGGDSQFPITTRIKRLAILGAGTVVFFVVASLNLLLGIVVSHPLLLYALGIRDPKTVAGSMLLLFAFVYLIFVQIIGLPVDIF
jgi:hypothetical protein